MDWGGQETYEPKFLAGLLKIMRYCHLEKFDWRSSISGKQGSILLHFDGYTWIAADPFPFTSE